MDTIQGLARHVKLPIREKGLDVTQIGKWSLSDCLTLNELHGVPTGEQTEKESRAAKFSGFEEQVKTASADTEELYVVHAHHDELNAERDWLSTRTEEAKAECSFEFLHLWVIYWCSKMWQWVGCCCRSWAVVEKVMSHMVRLVRVPRSSRLARISIKCSISNRLQKWRVRTSVTSVHWLPTSSMWSRLACVWSLPQVYPRVRAPLKSLIAEFRAGSKGSRLIMCQKRLLEAGKDPQFATVVYLPSSANYSDILSIWK